MSEQAAIEQRSKPARPRDDADEQVAEDESARFDDPYWDDAFCAWWDPALRTCC